ncbi:12488_t:CDS:10, partial [Cetraspora pellucida]
IEYSEQLEKNLEGFGITKFDYPQFTDIKVIGIGASATVFSSTYQGNKYALKSLNNNINLDKNGSEMIKHELRLLYQLNHPNIVKFYDPQAKNFIIVLQLANNETLRKYLSLKQEEGLFKISWAELIRIAKEIVFGLKYLHSKAIIHRDLHSNNILINDRKALIADFGLGKQFGQTPTLSSSVKGITSYVDPQSLKNNDFKLNYKSDIYSLGVLLWELTSGVPPFRHLKEPQILLEVINGRRENPVENTPSDYISLYKKCWSSDPDRRPTLVKILGTLDKSSNKPFFNFIKNDTKIVPKSCQLIPEDSIREPRLLVVSHFLPRTIIKTVNGYKLEMAYDDNGVVNMLSELKKTKEFIWIGWPRGNCLLGERDYIISQLNERQCHPVFIEESLIKRYDRFSKSIIWQLFHYHHQEIVFHQKDWNAYKGVNSLFANTINDIVQDGDLIWIHGYHLMLLPDMLREKFRDRELNVKIGMLPVPVREEILTSVLKSDLVGFQTINYARHFQSSCVRILGLFTMPTVVYYEGRRVHVDAFPIGINPEIFTKSLKQFKVQEHIKNLKEKFKNVKIIFGVDRLDYIKGVPQKFHALDLFLSKNPNWIGKVVLIQITKPSRWDTKENQNLSEVVNELAGKINEKFSTCTLVPIHYTHRSISFEELLALYVVSDVFIVSSIRDGMNRLPYEYVICQQYKNGVLILSEFAGAAQHLEGKLFIGSILVNPWDTYEFSEAIYKAVTMPEHTRKSNYQKLHCYVTNHTISFWGNKFVDTLMSVKEYNSQIVIPHLNINQVIEVANIAKRRIILLDYDKTLITEEKAFPSNNIITTLKELQEKPNTYVYILSGRGKVHLDELFESTGVGLSAEHGCFYKHPRCLQRNVNQMLYNDTKFIKEEQNGWYRLVEHIDRASKQRVLDLFKHYKERNPEISIEKNDIGIICHYSNSGFGLWQALDLQVNLMSYLVHMSLNVGLFEFEFFIIPILNDNILEIRSSLVDQSTAVRAIFKDLQITHDDLVLCIGDEKPDEPVFSLLKDNNEFNNLNYFTSAIGKERTNATFFLKDIWDVRDLLDKLVIGSHDLNNQHASAFITS